MSKFSLGLCGGCDSVIKDVLLANSLEEVLESPERVHRWGNLGYIVLGLAVWEDMDPKSHEPQIATLLLQGCAKACLLAFGPKPEPKCFQCMAVDKETAFEEVLSK